MKRFLAAALTVCMLSGISGCTRQTQSTPEPDTGQGATLEVTLSNSYRAEPFQDDDFPSALMIPCSGKVLLCGYTDTAPTYLGLFDPAANTITKGEAPDMSQDIKGAVLSDGKLELFVQTFTPDGVYESALLTYDEELNLLNTEDVTGIWNQTYIYSWRKDAAGNEYVGDADGVRVRRNGETPRQIPDVSHEQKLSMGRDGTVICVSIGGGKPSRIDLSTMTAVPVELEGLPKNGHNNGNYFDGTDEYDFLCSDETALYGVQIAEGVRKELVNWSASDFLDCDECVALSDGRFVIRSFDYVSLKAEQWLLTARTQEEVDNLQLLSIASCNFSQSNEMLIARFNRQAEGFRLVPKSYYDEKNYQGGIDKLKEDLLAGVVPDILYLTELDYQLLANKGLFEDMRPWMENDPNFHSEDYMINFLESMAYKGRMERIGFQFSIEGVYMAKTKYLNGQTILTAQDVLSLDLPDGMSYWYDAWGREMIFDGICHQQLGSFVDYANATCSFDSPEFISLLELINTVPGKQLPSDDYGCRDDRILFCQPNLGDLGDYHFAKEVLFGGEDVTLAGLTCSEGNGAMVYAGNTMAVSSVSAHKEEAWEFIKFCMQAENCDANYGFPINRAALEQAMTKDIQRDAETEIWTYVMDGVNVEISAATQAEADELMVYLEGIKACTFADSKVIAIVQEEAGKYFAGDQTVEACATAIQNRVSIYLAEQM